MSEDCHEVTQEKFQARFDFVSDLFSMWKKKLCQNVGAQSPAFLDYEDKIIWRIDKDGTEYSPHKLCTLYFHHYRPRAKYLMKEPEHFLDRHKIVALTQRVILEHWPITYSTVKPFHRFNSEDMPVVVRTLNVSFAYHFAIEFLGTWNKEMHEKVLRQPFDADNLFMCLGSTDFAEEHRKFLMLDHLEVVDPTLWDDPFSEASEVAFPAILIAQLWFALEQWGLAHMRSTAKPPAG